MPSTTKIVSVSWFDSCFVDYLTESSSGDDLDGKEGTYTWVVGVERGGQTVEELIGQVIDAVSDEEGFPYGDSIHELLEEQVKKAVEEQTLGRDWHLWPMDSNGKEITDEEVDVPEEQPSAWFRVVMEWHPLKISLRNTDDDDGQVMVDCADGEGAANDQYIDGSTWEDLEDGTAYTLISDRPTLVAELEKEGYDVDQSEYSPPDQEDLRYWHAKCEKDESNYPDGAMLREIMGWTSLDDVRECRRVSEQQWLVTRACGTTEHDERYAAFVQACWDAGLPLDAERWLRDRK